MAVNQLKLVKKLTHNHQRMRQKIQESEFNEISELVQLLHPPRARELLAYIRSWYNSDAVLSLSFCTDRKWTVSSTANCHSFQMPVLF